MAVVPVDVVESSCAGTLRVYHWNGITEADTAEGIAISGGTPLSIMVEGDFGVGGEVGAEGSNVSGGNFYKLQTLDSFSASGISPIAETALIIRPSIEAGTGLDVDVYLMVRGV